MNRLLDPEIQAGAMPIIVSNYAKLFGIRVRMQGLAAYTNGDVINLPRLNLSDPLVARYAYGYLAHEAGHCRFTDFEVVKECKSRPLLFTIFNILEDARIERLISREFVGVFENLELTRSRPDEWERFFKASGAPDYVMPLVCAYLMTACALRIQGFAPREQARRLELIASRLEPQLKPGALAQLDSIVDRLQHAADSEAVAVLASEVVTILEQPQFFTNETPQFDALKDKAPQQEQEQEQEQESDNSGGSDTRSQASNSEPDNSIRSQLQQQVGRLAEFEKFMRMNPDAADAMVPGLDPHSWIEGFGDTQGANRDDLGMINQATARAGDAQNILRPASEFRINALRSALTSRAIAYVSRHSAEDSSGDRLNIRKALFVAQGETDIFKKRRLERDYNTLIQVLVDYSGSMMCEDGGTRTRAAEASLAAYAIASALDGVSGIQTRVLSFPGRRTECEEILNPSQHAKNRAAYFDQLPRGSTPLAQALWDALGFTMQSEADRKIVIVITDGIPDSADQARLALDKCEEAGVEVHGIGIRLGYVRDLFAHSTVIDSAAELVSTAFKLVADLFKK